MHTVHANQDPTVIARAVDLAWRDTTTLAVIPCHNPDIDRSARKVVEQYARCNHHADVTWVGNVAEFTPNWDRVTA